VDFGSREKRGGLLREKVGMRYQSVAQEKKVYPVSMLCRVMSVSRSGFYDHEKRVAQDPDPDHQDLVEMVRKISDSLDHTYGRCRAIHHDAA